MGMGAGRGIASISGSSGTSAGRLVRPASQYRAGVDTSEAKAIGDRVVRLDWPTLVSYEVNSVAGRIWSAQIESRCGT